MRKIWLYGFIWVAFGYNCFAQSDLLDRVPELQETARMASGGKLGCGYGSMQIVTSNGEITVGVDLDPIHVFGRKVAVSDLTKLLEARAEANLTRAQNPMSGSVSQLGYLVLSTLAMSKDQTAIPVIAKLLDDPDETIRGWSAIALFRLAESGEELKRVISKITFPENALQSSGGRGVKSPDWVVVREEKLNKPIL